MKFKAGLFLFCSFFCISSFAISHVGNAGAGLIVDGEYMSFYSAHVRIQKDPLHADQIPGMNYLQKNLWQFNINDNAKAQALTLFYPGIQRKYFKAEQNEIPQDMKDKILAKYSEILGIPADKIVIFAITNAETGNTFLTPEFFKMSKESDQAALLFHEAIWVARPNFTYDEVVNAEQALQAYFEKSQQPETYYSFYLALSAVLNDPWVSLWSSLTFDQKQPRVLLKDILGEKFVRCELRFFHDHPGRLDGRPLDNICAEILRNDLIFRSTQEKNSLFVRSSIRYLQSPGTFLFMKAHEPSPGPVPDETYAEGMSETEYADYINHLYVAIHETPESSKGFQTFNLEFENGEKAGAITWIDNLLSPWNPLAPAEPTGQTSKTLR